MSTSTAIQQRINAGSLFTGVLPAGDAPLDAGHSIYKYAAGVLGGLFFWNVREPIICSQIHLDLGAPGDVTVSLVNLDPATIDTVPAVLAGEEIIIEQATAVRFIALDEARFKTVLLPFQAIRVVTAVTAAAQVCQAVASLERTYVR
jgi:hypothetical protein